VNNIEVIIVLLLLFMAVPDLCRKARRPALAFSVFVLLGFVLAPWLSTDLVTMVRQAGHVGFLLLLFEVGLEIDLPRLREFLPPLRFALLWCLAQGPLAALLAIHAGLNLQQAFVAGAALTGCSVSMAHQAWKNFSFGSESVKGFVLLVMVALEMLSIVAMAVGTTVLKDGLSWWILFRLLGITVVVVLIGRYASLLVGLVQKIITRTTHWRLHWLVLFILAICALGNRLGLDSAKTAFVLGLAMSRAKHAGMNLEAYMAPISHRFLIPLFFVSLGLQIEWGRMSAIALLLALGTAGMLLGVREVLHRRWLRSGSDGPIFLLLSPNLTLVAISASALLEFSHAPGAAAWLLVTGLFVTVPSILMLPASPPDVPQYGPASGDTSEAGDIEAGECGREPKPEREMSLAPSASTTAKEATYDHY
jgi:Kef-type K+ transport system membrane component KefB